MVKETKNWGCVFQDMEPPKSSLIFRKSSAMRRPIRRVRFTDTTERFANIRDQNPSLGMICPGDPHQWNPKVPKFEDRSQEETEWQEQGARQAAWKLAKNIIKLKEKNKATIFSPSENRCLPASTLKPEERGASMHMISKKDFSDAEMDTLTKLCCLTIVITANGEVQTHEEATFYVNELDLFLTVKNPRRYASSVTARKALRGSLIFIWVDQWSKTMSHQKCYSYAMQYWAPRSDRGPGFIYGFFFVKLVWNNTSDIITAAKHRIYTCSSVSWMWECRRRRTEKPVKKPNQKIENKKWRTTRRTGKPVKFRNTRMAARIQGKSRGMEAFLNLMEPEFLFSVTHTRALPINPL